MDNQFHRFVNLGNGLGICEDCWGKYPNNAPYPSYGSLPCSKQPGIHPDGASNEFATLERFVQLVDRFPLSHNTTAFIITALNI